MKNIIIDTNTDLFLVKRKGAVVNNNIIISDVNMRYTPNMECYHKCIFNDNKIKISYH